MKVLSAEKRLHILAALVDGNSHRAIERMHDVEKKTVGRFALRLGQGAAWLHNAQVRDLACPLIQVDEIWSYIRKKEARVDPEKDGPDAGDAYTFVGLDVSSRLAISFLVGKRNQDTTDAFIRDLRSRLTVMPQMTSDGFQPYVPAIGKSFGYGVDYSQMKKNYRIKGRRDTDIYEPAREPFITKRLIFGAPDMEKCSTSYIERQNGTMRHHIGRIRRRCYAFSKKIDNHRAAVMLAYTHYNFCHVVKTLRCTPAMQAGITDHIWDLDEFLERVLTAAPCEAPSAKPLVPKGPARALPNGGFLRLLKSPSAKPGPGAPPAPATPGAGRAPAAPAPAGGGAPGDQLDLFAPRPRRPLPLGQLSLFDDPPPAPPR